jgi:hypothetical protein
MKTTGPGLEGLRLLVALVKFVGGLEGDAAVRLAGCCCL